MILALDTSCDRASCALAKDGRLVGESFVHGNRRHSETLLPMVEDLLCNHNILPRDITLFAVSQGPGSFTGLRIGMATVQAMAFALNRRVVCMPTLDLLAGMLPRGSGLGVPLIDARNNQVYTALYRWKEDGYVRITGYMGIPVSELKDLLKHHDGPWYLAGDAALKHHEFLGCSEPEESVRYPSAGTLALAAGPLHAAGRSVAPEEVLPFYLRPSQAERLSGA